MNEPFAGKMRIQVRTAVSADIDAMLELHHRSIKVLCGRRYTAEQIAAWIAVLTPERYREGLSKMFAVVAQDGGQLLGLAMLEIESSELQAVYVAPEFVGRGVGAALLEALEAEAVRRSIGQLLVRASLNAEPFYAKHGFQRQTLEYFPVTPQISLECIAMTKSLSTQWPVNS